MTKVEAPEAFVLTAGDRQSGTWVKLLAHMEKRVAELRRENDAFLSEAKTTEIRAKIAAYKALIDLDIPPPVVEQEHSHFVEAAWPGETV